MAVNYEEKILTSSIEFLLKQASLVYQKSKLMFMVRTETLTSYAWLLAEEAANQPVTSERMSFN